MKIRFFLFAFIALFSVTASAQEIMEREQIFIKNLNSVYQNPEQTIKVADYLLENATSNSEKAKALYLLSKGKILSGATSEGIEDLFRAKEILKENESPFIASLVLASLSEQCRMAGVEDIASTDLQKAINLSKEIISEKELAIANTVIFKEESKIFARSKNYEKTFQKLKQSENLSNNEVPALRAITQNEFGNYYLNSSKIDSAEVHFKKSIAILKSSELNDSSIESVALQGLGKVYLLKDDLETSIQYHKSALKIPFVENPIKIEVFDNLSELYKRMDSISLAQKFYNEKALLNASMLDSERNVRSVIISYIDAEQQNNLLDDKKNYYKWGAGLAVLFLLIFGGYYFYNRKLNREYQRFQKVIAQVEKDEKLEAPFSIDDTSLKPSKGIVIPEETEKNILERLEEFEATTKFANSNMNLSLLAKQMKTNSKYISEIIHTHKQKNFNTYINELRVNYIIHLMKTDKAYLNYKVSYLAETCGFSSHSAFTVVFKSITGFTPKQFIAFLKKSKKEKTATF